MRLAALLLLLANLAAFAWVRYAPEPGTLESQLLAQQMRPESVRVLTAEQVKRLAEPKPQAGTEPQAGTAQACLEWGAFSAADLPKARALLQGVAAAASVSERQAEEPAGWWVYMPPQPNRQAANQKVAELKRLGVEEYFIVQDDPKLRLAISLGVYRSEDAARARLEQLRAIGVRSAAMGPRQTPVPKAYLQIRRAPSALQEREAELREAFPGTLLKDCSP